MTVLRRILLVGFPLLFFIALLVVLFPNAEWNRGASQVVWMLGIILIFLALALSVLSATRLAAKIAKHSQRLPAGVLQGSTTPSRSQRRRRVSYWLIGALAAVVFVGLLLALIQHEIKSSPVYQMSVAKAEASLLVSSALGPPVTEGWLVTGRITESTDGSGYASLSIPLKGSKKKGRLHVEGGRSNGSWRLLTLRLVPEGNNSTLDLLSGKDQ